MITLKTLALAAILSGASGADSNQPVLLDFYADWCGPCRAMDPVIRRLVADGYAVEKVDIDKQKQLAARYRVDRVPTYVIVVNGREVDRSSGATSYDRLKQRMLAAKPNVRPNQPLVRAQSPNPAPAAAPATANDPRTQCLHATVRLKIGDPGGHSYGTGTIIDTHDQEALILTCGHVFRDSGRNGEIMVDLFAPNATGPVRGHLVRYDLKNDIGFVSIRPGIRVTAAKVAPAGYRVQRGDPVFSIGCDRGSKPATVWDSRVTGLNKYQGPDNIEVARQPIIGRSGGGLFTADGQLIGVCNLADPQDDEGIYAALSVLQNGLDTIGQARIYRRNSEQLVSNAVDLTPFGSAKRNPDPFANPADAKSLIPNMPAGMPGTSADPRRAPTSNDSQMARLAAALRNADADTEVICIVRSRTNPAQSSQHIVLNENRQALLNALMRAPRQPDSRPDAGSPVELQAAQGTSPYNAPPSRRTAGGQLPGQQIRGQSLR